MGTLLKVLTVIILLLSILAFVMGLSNFNKRELLIGRTHALEEKIIQLGMTLEEEDPVFEGVANHPEYDIDEVTDRALDMPNKSDFWSSYDDALEVMATPTLDLRGDSARQQLRSYYLTQIVEGKPVVQKDFQGRPKTTGKGTMDELLNKQLDLARNQLKRLNTTRAQLTTVREELETVIELLNTEKRERRGNLATITQLNQKIGELEAEIDRKNIEIAKLEREKSELNDVITELRASIALKDEQLVAYDVQVKRLEEEIRKIRDIMSTPGTDAKPTVGGVTQLSAGTKGEIVRVDREWAYVLVKLTPEAAVEISNGGSFVPVEMMVHRKTAAGDVIVSRLRITNPPNKDGVVVADNVYGWEQMPIEIGDSVVY